MEDEEIRTQLPFKFFPPQTLICFFSKENTNPPFFWLLALPRAMKHIILCVKMWSCILSKNNLNALIKFLIICVFFSPKISSPKNKRHFFFILAGCCKQAKGGGLAFRTQGRVGFGLGADCTKSPRAQKLPSPIVQGKVTPPPSCACKKQVPHSTRCPPEGWQRAPWPAWF